MTRFEWLDTLREALYTEMPQSEIDNNIAYYRNYIDKETETKAESDVLGQLGDPRLIAHTIIESFQIQSGSVDRGFGSAQGFSNPFFDQQADQGSTVDEDQEYGQDMDHTYGFHVTQIKWYHKLIFAAIIVLIITVILFIGSIAIRLLIRIGIPLLIIFLLFSIFHRK